LSVKGQYSVKVFNFRVKQCKMKTQPKGNFVSTKAHVWGKVHSSYPSFKWWTWHFPKRL